MALSSQTKETILVADDEASIRRILETRLSMIGYKVVTASDGKEALKLFKDYEPDLVVLDVMMPKLDGYGVCQELRKDSDVPIVMLTALGDVADRITGLELGADDYVVKPFSPKELEARIRCVLRRIDKEQIPGMPNSGLILVTDIKIDTNRRQVFKSDERIEIFSQIKIILNEMNHEERIDVIEMMWGVILSDGIVDDFEANLMRRMNGLLYVSGEESALAKQRALNQA